MKILIGYDGSAPAKAALKDLGKAGLPAKAEALVIVDVAPILSPNPYLLGASSVAWFPDASTAVAQVAEQADEEALKTGKEAMEFLKARYPGWKVRLELTYGVPAQEILHKAEAWKPQLIVLGSRGWTRLGNLLLGSTAEKVLGHAHGSIRIARPLARSKPSAPRLLIAMDGSPDANAALAEVARRSWPKGTRATLLAVMDFRLNLNEVMTAIDKASKGKTAAGEWPWMKQKLQAAQAKLAGKGLKADVLLLSGEPRNVLLQQAKRSGADCIFMGSRGMSGIQRFLTGSVASGVAAHAPCSVEVFRNPVRAVRTTRGKSPQGNAKKG